MTRVYQDLSALKVVTDEDAECVYSQNDCNYVFDEGLALLKSNPSIKNVHYAEWKANAGYYVKCRDEKGNEPSPNDCSVVVTTVEL